MILRNDLANWWMRREYQIGPNEPNMATGAQIVIEGYRAADEILTILVKALLAERGEGGSTS